MAAYPAKIYRTITKQFYERLPAASQKRISNAAAKHNQQTVNIEIQRRANNEERAANQCLTNDLSNYAHFFLLDS